MYFIPRIKKIIKIFTNSEINNEFSITVYSIISSSAYEDAYESISFFLLVILIVEDVKKNLPVFLQ